MRGSKSEQEKLFAIFPNCYTEAMAWSTRPLLLQSLSSHEDGGQQNRSGITKRFVGKTSVEKLEYVRLFQRGLQAAYNGRDVPLQVRGRGRSSYSGNDFP